MSPKYLETVLQQVPVTIAIITMIIMIIIIMIIIIIIIMTTTGGYDDVKGLGFS